MDDVELVFAHHERAVIRVGDTFLKVDPNADRVAVELAAMERADVPTPEVRWHQHPVLALARLPGRCLGSPVGDPTASPAAWQATGEVVRQLHDQPVSGEWPQWYGAATDTFVDDECRWLVDEAHLTLDVADECRAVASRVDRPFDPVVIHGDLQPAHVFVEEDRVTGIIDWSDTCLSDPLFDIAVLTLWHPDQLDQVLAGYGEVDRRLIEGWWAHRRLGEVRWLVEHGFDPSPTLEALRGPFTARRIDS